MVYRPVIEKECYQLDGSKFQGTNCGPSADSVFIRRATHGSRRPSSRGIRARTGDTEGGTNLRQLHLVNTTDFGVRGVLYQPIAWDDLMDHFRAGRGALLDIWYGVLRVTSHDASRRRYSDNHRIYVNHLTKYGNLRYFDPLADGRYQGCPEGWQSIKPAVLKDAAGKLDLSGLGTGAYRPLGAGKAYALLIPKGT
jgi:hypothetical protein